MPALRPRLAAQRIAFARSNGRVARQSATRALPVEQQLATARCASRGTRHRTYSGPLRQRFTRHWQTGAGAAAIPIRTEQLVCNLSAQPPPVGKSESNASFYDRSFRVAIKRSATKHRGYKSTGAPRPDLNMSTTPRRPSSLPRGDACPERQYPRASPAIDSCGALRSLKRA